MAVSRIKMARDGPEFSRIAQGFGSVARWNKSPAELLNHVRRCMHLGVTTMDLAPIYGRGQAEALLGETLALDASLRDKLELVTKCCIGQWDTLLYHYDTSKAHILWSVDQSLANQAIIIFVSLNFNKESVFTEYIYITLGGCNRCCFITILQ